MLQLLRGASSEPLWPDLDDGPPDRQPVPHPEGFAYLPWWFTAAYGNRGMLGFWGLDPPATVSHAAMRGRHVHALWASVGLTWLAHAGAGTFGCHPDAEVGLGSGECCDSCVAARKVLLACHGRCPPPPLQLSWYHWEVDDAFASPEDPNPKQLPPPEAPRLLAMAPGVGWNTTTEEEFRGMALQVWGWVGVGV